MVRICFKSAFSSAPLAAWVSWAKMLNTNFGTFSRGQANSGIFVEVCLSNQFVDHSKLREFSTLLHNSGYHSRVQ